MVGFSRLLEKWGIRGRKRWNWNGVCSFEPLTYYPAEIVLSPIHKQVQIFIFVTQTEFCLKLINKLPHQNTEYLTFLQARIFWFQYSPETEKYALSELMINSTFFDYSKQKSFPYKLGIVKFHRKCWKSLPELYYVSKILSKFPKDFL